MFRFRLTCRIRFSYVRRWWFTPFLLRLIIISITCAILWVSSRLSFTLLSAFFDGWRWQSKRCQNRNCLSTCRSGWKEKVFITSYSSPQDYSPQLELAQSGHCLTGSPGRHKTTVNKITFQVPGSFSKSRVLFLHSGYLLHWGTFTVWVLKKLSMLTSLSNHTHTRLLWIKIFTCAGEQLPGVRLTGFSVLAPTEYTIGSALLLQ